MNQDECGVVFSMSSLDKYNKVSQSGQWVIDESGSIMWQETTTLQKYDVIMHTWLNEKPTIKLISPEDSPFHCTKEAVVDLLILLEKEDLDSSTGKSIFFYNKKVKLTVKPDFKNVYLTKGDDLRYYCKDLLNFTTHRIDPTNSERVKCVKVSEKRITKEEAQKLGQTTGYVFSRQDESPEGTLYGRFVAPKNYSGV